jgi:hypothetical protein
MPGVRLHATYRRLAGSPGIGALAQALAQAVEGGDGGAHATEAALQHLIDRLLEMITRVELDERSFPSALLKAELSAALTAALRWMAWLKNTDTNLHPATRPETMKDVETASLRYLSTLLQALSTAELAATVCRSPEVR